MYNQEILKTKKHRKVYFCKESRNSEYLLNFIQSKQYLEFGIPLCMEAFIDKKGNIYSRVEIEKKCNQCTEKEEVRFLKDKGIKICYLEIKNIEDYYTMGKFVSSNSIINPSYTDKSTSLKLNSTLEILTNPSYCLNEKKCENIKAELIREKPITIDKLISMKDKYIDENAMNILFTHCSPMVYNEFKKSLDWSQFDLEEQHRSERVAEIIWGKDLVGAEVFSKDLEVAQITARDIDGANIPNNTPEERVSIKNEIEKAYKLVQEQKDNKGGIKKNAHVKKETKEH